MSINIPIRTTSKKYGFITDNSRVHGNSNLEGQSYGASSFGEKGLGNHSSLKSIFSHRDSIINGGNNSVNKDTIVAAAFLQGRNDLSGKELAGEIADAISIITAKKEEREVTLAAEDPPGDSANDPVFQQLVADESVLSGIIANQTNDPAALSALLVSSEFEYNPDFPLSNVNFGYGAITTETSRANDLHNRTTAVATSPNVNFPSLNPTLNDNEAEASAASDVKGLDGQGGFGSSASSNFSTSSIIAAIMNRYIQ
jgi:hypothetical protein